jgi:chromosome segregation ATPase
MAISTDRLIQFFEQVKTLTFWQRLLKWSRFRSLSYDAYEEFKALLSENTKYTQELDSAKTSVTVLTKDNEHLKTLQYTLDNEVKALKEKVTEHLSKISELTPSLATKEEALRQTQEKVIRQETEITTLKEKQTSSTERISELTSSLATKDEALKQAQGKLNERDAAIATSNERINQLTQENTVVREENTIFKQTEEDRKTKYERDVASLNSIRDQIQADRSREIAEAHQKEIERLNRLRETWANHQEATKNAIKMICERHTIEYVDNVPFKGNPDNTIKICDEYVIFDAKSPGSDDLANFPTYIKTQTESVKKYIKEEGVKKDIYLVIPSNTVEVIDRFSYNMADYAVYVVTLDALEPIILSLKKLEEYEFIDQLSPEERDNICRVIGKFAHMTKRRIQIDQFFERQFLEVLSKCEADLPRDILEKVVDYERSEKLNPPQEKRAKLISSSELESDSVKIRREAEAKAIAFPASVEQGIKSLPLYNDESSNDNKE